MSDMVKIDNSELREQILDYIVELRELQEKSENYVLYCSLKLSTIIKNDLLIKSFLVHPQVLRKKKFYEDYQIVEENQLSEIVDKVLEYEFTSNLNECKLTRDEINKLLDYRKKVKEDI